MVQQTILETQALQKIYATQERADPVISQLDLTLSAGTFTVIMGRSGSGKSTLLHLLSGLDRVSDGKIYLMQEEVQHRSEKEWALLRRQHIGFVFQQAYLVPNLTVLENVLVAGYLSKQPKAEVRELADALLQQTGLQDLGNRLPAQLSGGEQQRAAIVRALINQPRLLFADEPTGSLNAAAAKAILELFADFHQRGQTILMATHDIKSACYGQRVLYFRDGQVVATLHFDSEPLSIREKQLSAWLIEQGW